MKASFQEFSITNNFNSTYPERKNFNSESMISRTCRDHKMFAKIIDRKSKSEDFGWKSREMVFQSANHSLSFVCFASLEKGIKEST